MTAESHLTEHDPATPDSRGRQSLRSHVLTYLTINGALWAVWALSGAGFPWPIFPTAGWAVGLALNAREAFRRDAGGTRSLDGARAPDHPDRD